MFLQKDANVQKIEPRWHDIADASHGLTSQFRLHMSVNVLVKAFDCRNRMEYLL
jgi:hypothetical protein